jgi:hypothetical protein
MGLHGVGGVGGGGFFGEETGKMGRKTGDQEERLVAEIARI